MFIPLHDSNNLKHIRLQWVTLSLIGLNVLIWAVTELAGAPERFRQRRGPRPWIHSFGGQ
jgi:membrane associated rhomboid family serine protease